MNPQPRGRFRGRWVTLARWAWAALAVFVILLLALGVVIRYAELVTVTPEAAIAFGQLRPQDLSELARLNIAPEMYAAYFTLAELVTSLVFILVACVIFWRRSEEWVALFVATMLLLLPSVLPLISAVERAALLPALLLRMLQVMYYACLTIFLFIFPNGHVVPRAARVLIGVLLVYAPATLFVPALVFPVSFGAGVTPRDYLPLGIAMAIYLFGFGAQAWRYFRISNRAQRQQTKWVVFGLGVFSVLATLGIAIVIVSPAQNGGAINLAPRIVAPTLILLAILALPISIGFSILRYRLYDIDIIIRRTVTYALVVTVLGAVYFASVIGLQRMFVGIAGEQPEFITVLSTLAIAILFVPLRNRVQNAIDKRFNRQKYDAQQVLQKFALTVRDETDLEKLSAELLNVVNETMQPKRVSVWLKNTDGGRRTAEK
jgi:hypothetical protein